MCHQQLTIGHIQPWLNQGHLRHLTLGDEAPLRIYHHPGPVPLQPAGQQACLLHRNTSTGLDRKHPQRAYGACDIEIGLQLCHLTIVRPR